MSENWKLIHVPHGWGATNTGAYLAPEVLVKSSCQGRHIDDLFAQSSQVTISSYPQEDFVPLKGDKLDERWLHCREATSKVYNEVQTAYSQGSSPFVFGGDQSISVGTWSAVLDHVSESFSGAPLGLIWMDAHLDAHTKETSLSQAPHGMPVSSLLGKGEKMPGQSLLRADRLVYIGIRSFEEGEHEFLNKLGVKIYYQEDVDFRGIQAIFEEARAYVSRGGSPYGIALDIDVFDPVEAPGTGAPEEGGLKANETLPLFKDIFQDPKFVAFEMVEFNPKRDKDDLTLKLIWNIILSAKGELNG